MRKLVACALMLALMIGFTSMSSSPLFAQEKKTTKKDTKKDKPTETGTIEITEGKDGKFRFNIRNADGKYLGGSGLVGYNSEKEVRAAIEEMKNILATAVIVKGKAKTKDSKDKDK